MAKDADGNYYYDAGTINEQFDDVEIVEDSDGKLSLVVGGNEIRVHDLALGLRGQRSPPTTDELDQGEKIIYVTDASGAASAPVAGDVVATRNNGGTIETTVLGSGYQAE
jgi:hypothetical protein